MKNLLTIALLLLAAGAKAQDATPSLEYAMDIVANIEGGFINVGAVPDGYRTIIPITGGHFEGPGIKGEVVAGGADYQLHSATTQMTQLCAIYSIRTNDSINIMVRNEGIIVGNDYFFTTPHFQAPVDSKYDWLNKSTFVCRPVGGGPGSIKLRVWRVCDAAAMSPVETKFEGIPASVFTEAAHKGTVEEYHYTANLDGSQVQKRAQVYLPYGYNAKDKSKRYNVVYLIHGGGDNTTSFFSDPRSPLPLTRVLDHLIEDGAMDPVIVVAPTFYRDDTNIGANRMDDAIKLTRDFHNELHDAVIPSVEMAYNTYLTSADSIEATRGHRAFGGFSMGALTTWYQLAYGNADVSRYIPLSGDLWVYDNDGNKISLDAAAVWLNDKIAAQPHADDFRVYGYTGTDDIAGTPERTLFEALRKNAPLVRVSSPDANASLVMKDGGKHYYGDINEYLYEVLPMLWPKQ